MAAAADFPIHPGPGPAAAANPHTTRLVWGPEDDFQKVSFAHRYVTEITGSDLVEVNGKHTPTEDAPDAVAHAILEHLGT